MSNDSNSPAWMVGFLGTGAVLHLVRSDTLVSKCGIAGKKFTEDHHQNAQPTCNRCG